ncbi:hypothetical protein SDC9_156242 [bioreactor metagenome]|uniref:Uncharacterized protein n=1 Tax=bioreactor metagenome TaxID=1076179 RepID=A0A645F8M7_9ZZZZ
MVPKTLIGRAPLMQQRQRPPTMGEALHSGGIAQPAGKIPGMAKLMNDRPLAEDSRIELDPMGAGEAQLPDGFGDDGHAAQPTDVLLAHRPDPKQVFTGFQQGGPRRIRPGAGNIHLI